MNYLFSNFEVDIPSVLDSINQYGYLGTSKILSESYENNLDNLYVAGILYALYLKENAVDIESFMNEHETMYNPFVYEFMTNNYQLLAKYIVEDRDYTYQFASIKSIAESYLFKYEGKPIESLQWMYMRAAVQVAAPSNWKDMSPEEYIIEIIDTYNMFSLKEAIHATPTMINSGYIIPQLESCFCVNIGDNMLSIADCKKLLLIGSKCNGGFGIFLGNIRHGRVANRGITKGVPGLLRTINSDIPYADQLGSRPMAVTAYLPIWHCDILIFIQMKDPNAPLDIKASNLNYSICIPDFFMKMVLEDGDWCLFCPRECKIQWVANNGGDINNTHHIDNAPSLCDVWGEEFQSYYTMCINAGISRNTIKARDLYTSIMSARCRYGQPFLFFDDNVNRKSNHSNIGKVLQSNLCTEITQVTSNNDSPLGEVTATCDLATINVESLFYLDESHNGCINWNRLGELTRQLVRNLDRIIDRTSGILPNEGQKELEELMLSDNPVIRELAVKMYRFIQKDPTHASRTRTRSFGIGCMGMASLFSMMKYKYISNEATQLGATIRAAIYWHSLDESANLARIKGSYPTFDGSPASKGILQMDMWDNETEYMKKYISDIKISGSAKYIKQYTDAIHRYKWDIIDPSAFGINDSWDNMRLKVQGGLRNSLNTCQMPNVNTSLGFSVSPSMEPFYEMLYAVSNINGTDTATYDCMRRLFIQENVYRSKDIAKYLIENRGVITGLHTIYTDPAEIDRVKLIEGLFQNSFSMNKKKYLLFIQRMGYYIDQAQSTNIFFDHPNVSYLERLTIMAWINGNKTEYYLRRLASEEKINPFCIMNSDCKSCQ